MNHASTALISLVIAAGAIASTAQAGDRQDRAKREKVVTEFCRGNDSRDCKDFRAKKQYWSDSNYRAFYNRNLTANTDPDVARVFGVEPPRG